MGNHLASSVSCLEHRQRMLLLPAKGQRGKGHDLTLALHQCTHFIPGKDAHAVSLIYTLQRLLEGVESLDSCLSQPKHCKDSYSM